MAKLWLFNPDNDLALAADKDFFTPPAAAARLRRSGAALPLWLAGPGDFVMAGGINDRWLSALERDFGPMAFPWDRCPDVLPSPWGWSRAAATDFRQAGVAAQNIPNAAWLEKFRALSGRGTAAKVHAELARRIDFPLWPAAVKVGTEAALAEVLRRWPEAVVKTPWSSSGRGVQFVDAAGAAKLLPSVLAAIRRYGYVTVERRASRLCDFAMLFRADSAGVAFEGLSWFDADAAGRYKSNLVAPQADILARVARYYPPERLTAVAAALRDILANVCRDFYCGPIGVDMLVAAAEGGNMLHPVVEINFRHTMGFVALALERRVEGAASLSVEAGDTTAICAPEVEAGRLTAGRLALTPPGGDFTFVLSMMS